MNKENMLALAAHLDALTSDGPLGFDMGYYWKNIKPVPSFVADDKYHDRVRGNYPNAKACGCIGGHAELLRTKQGIMEHNGVDPTVPGEWLGLPSAVYVDLFTSDFQLTAAEAALKLRGMVARASGEWTGAE
jgi:hypothetical protein